MSQKNIFVQQLVEVLYLVLRRPSLLYHRLGTKNKITKKNCSCIWPAVIKKKNQLPVGSKEKDPWQMTNWSCNHENKAPWFVCHLAEPVKVSGQWIPPRSWARDRSKANNWHIKLAMIKKENSKVTTIHDYSWISKQHLITSQLRHREHAQTL